MRAHLCFLFFPIIALMPCLASAEAELTCNPFVPHTRTVGDMAHDTHCTDADVQSAIDNACPNATIFLTQEIQYQLTQTLSIKGKTLSIVGTSATSCSSIGTTGVVATTPTAPLVTITGDGSHTVLGIQNDDAGNGSNVTLQYVEITGGGAGGVAFGGSGSLTLDTTTVDGNKNLDGGGVHVSGSGGGATVTLKHYTQILNNTASFNGGGIEIDGNARLFMLEDGSTIAFNHADPSFGATGGGIAVLGPARADIASPGAVLAGAVSNNTAALGGGISAIATGSGNAVVRLFSTDANRPVLVSQNSATQRGGAVYLKPDAQQNANTSASLCAYDFRIDSNTAPDGGAIYADFDSDDDEIGSGVYLNPAGDCGPEPRTALGAVACAAGTPCNEISDNSGIDTHSQITGPVLTLNHSVMAADRFAMRQNTAAQLINFGEGGDSNSMSNCLLADNHSVHELVHSAIGGLEISSCTIAQNRIDNGYVFFVGGDFTVTQSLIDQPGVSTIDYGDGCCLNASYTLSTEIATFPADSTAVALLTDPLFVDAANPLIDQRDYHLRAFVQSGVVTASPAIDVAPPVTGDDRDLDRNPHDQDVPSVPDLAGDRDLGCYEAQPILDRVFADAFGDRISILK